MFFALFTLYSLFESNDGVFDLAVSFLVTALVGLGVTLLCRWRFLKNHPNYRIKPDRASTRGRSPFGGGVGGGSPFTGAGSASGPRNGDGYTPGPTAQVPGGGIVTIIRLLMRMMGR